MSDARKKPDPYGVEGSAGSGPRRSAADGGAATMFSASDRQGVTVITFERADVLDAYEIEKLGDGIYHHVKTIETPRVVVDLKNVKHLSSAAIGMLVALGKVVARKRGGLCIANVSDTIGEVFKLTNIDKLIKIHDSTEAAVASLS